MSPCVLEAPCAGDAGLYGHYPLSSKIVFSKGVVALDQLNGLLQGHRSWAAKLSTPRPLPLE